MDERLPTVTILIAARPGQAEVGAVQASLALDYPADKLEVIIARGTQPSAQRNAGMNAARGEWIYFLDDDSAPPPENLRRAARYFDDPAVKMVGGPNLCPAEAPGLEQVFALVLSSWLAFGPSRARYSRVGQSRTTSEKELILCNLLARKAPMLELGGFNEALYPNEENALMDELQKRGGRLVYDPDFFVYRRPRATLKAFCKMLMTYGRGRAEQFRLHPTPGSALNFIPPLFCLYLLLVIGGLVFAPGSGWFLLPPLGIYVVAVIAQAAALLRVQREDTIASRRVFRALGAMPLIVLTHVLYGVGFWRGLATNLKSTGNRAPVRVTVETVGPCAKRTP